MAYVNPTIEEFKARFYRDFPFQPADLPVDINAYVQDQDIYNAFATSSGIINQELFPNEGNYSQGFNLLSAHYMVMALDTSSQGLNGQFDWLTSSKSVGSVSISYSIPQSILDNPYFALLAKTRYGAAYLAMILPYLVGPMFAVRGPGLVPRGSYYGGEWMGAY